MKSDRWNRGIYLTKLVFYADHLCWQLQTVYKLPVVTLVAIRYSHASLLFGGSVIRLLYRTECSRLRTPMYLNKEKY
jgi:uncharacterized membrane protein